MRPIASRRRSRSPTAPPYTGNLRLNSAVLQALSLSQLREICQSKGLSATGNRATLHKRLKDAGITSEGPEERRNASVSPQQTNDTPARPQRHETPFLREADGPPQALGLGNSLQCNQGNCQQSCESGRARHAGPTKSSIHG